MKSLIAALAVVALQATIGIAQQPNVRISTTAAYGNIGCYGPPAGFSPIGGFGPYGGYGAFGGYGPFGPIGGYGYGAVGGYGADFGAQGQLDFARQLYQQQSSLAQQVFQQQQQAIIDQIDEAKTRLERLEALKQQKFQEFLNMEPSDQAAVRLQMMNDYLLLDEPGRAAWKRDTVAQIILGREMPRLDELLQYRALDPDDQERFRAAMRDRYRTLSAEQQQTWRDDPIVANVLRNEW